jgi:hypothetical protein
MKYTRISTLQWFMNIAGCLTLTLLLAACDIFGGGASSSSTPTAVPTSIHTTATTSNPTPTLIAYNGGDYTLSYPSDWTKSSAPVPAGSGNAIKFTDSTGTTTITISDISNPNGIISTKTVLDTLSSALKASVKNYQTASIAQTTSVGGKSWDQQAATFDATEQGLTANIKQVMLAVNVSANPVNTKLYAISYAAPTVAFDTVNSAAFQPILQSFKFA